MAAVNPLETPVVLAKNIETLDQGGAVTGFLRFGDRVRMFALSRDGDGESPFGVIDQRVARNQT